MTNTNHPSALNTINPGLAKKIKNLPEERQFVLLKQLLKGDIAATLFKLIGKMSNDQQLTLLEQLQESPTEPVNPEETVISLRGHNRKSCMLATNYEVEGRNFENFMLDISPSGAFIETEKAFSAGQQIQLVFSLPNHPEQLTIAGEILWKGILGIGVKFKDLSRELIDIITAFMKEEERM